MCIIYHQRLVSRIYKQLHTFKIRERQHVGKHIGKNGQSI